MKPYEEPKPKTKVIHSSWVDYGSGRVIDLNSKAIPLAIPHDALLVEVDYGDTIFNGFGERASRVAVLLRFEWTTDE